MDPGVNPMRLGILMLLAASAYAGLIDGNWHGRLYLNGTQPEAPTFACRASAGNALAAVIDTLMRDVDAVAAIARGGLIVGQRVAAAATRPLTACYVARVVADVDGAHVTIGAVSSLSLMIDQDFVSFLGLSSTEVKTSVDGASARVKEVDLGRPTPSLAGLRVLVVDDGIGTGCTALAAIEDLTTRGATVTAVASPVAHRVGLTQLQDVGLTVATLCVDKRSSGNVCDYYASFDDISPSEANRIANRLNF